MSRFEEDVTGYSCPVKGKPIHVKEPKAKYK